jgi:hypothetical protein
MVNPELRRQVINVYKGRKLHTSRSNLHSFALVLNQLSVTC